MKVNLKLIPCNKLKISLKYAIPYENIFDKVASIAKPDRILAKIFDQNDSKSDFSKE